MTTSISEQYARARRRLARLADLIILGPLVGRMPKTSIESIEKFLYLDEIKKHVVDISTISDPLIVKDTLPSSYPKFFRKEIAFHKRDLFVLRDVFVSPFSGMVWFENRIIEESVGSLRRIMDWGDLLHEPLLPVEVVDLKEPVVVCPPTEYYHWLLEALPNLLHALSKFPEIKVIVPTNSPAYIFGALRILLRPEQFGSRLLFYQTPLKVNHLVMPQYHRLAEFTHPEDIKLLRTQIKSKIIFNKEHRAEDSPKCGQKIYISRRKTSKRKLIGEDLLESRLSSIGFTILYCEDISFEQQIETFHNAKTIVALHGAGLSNIVWSDAPCKVIEIFSKTYFLDCYAWLASIAGLDYEYVFCDSENAITQETINRIVNLL